MSTHTRPNPPALAALRPDPVEVPARSLRDAAGPDLLIGFALGGTLPDDLSDTEQRLVLRHASTITPENVMKPQPIHPREDHFHFDPADAFIDFAQTHQLKAIGHTLLWHQQCPDWFFRDDDPRQLTLRLEHHIHTVAGRYAGRIHAWDVVNEAVAEPGDDLRPTPWTRLLGEEAIALAFRFAHEADPHAELYYNDFNTEKPDKLQRTLRLLQRLLDRNLRIDAVGIQGHWQLHQLPLDDLEAAILAIHQLGLKTMITELDIDVIDRPDCGADVAAHHAYTLEDDLYRNGCPDEILSLQADHYARLFRLIHRHRDKISRVTFWGLHDGHSWLNNWPGKRTNHPLLFDRTANPKPAYHAVVNALDSTQPSESRT